MGWRRWPAVLLPLACTLTLPTACSDTPEEGTDEPCPGHLYTRDANRAVTEQLRLMATAVADGGPEEVRAIDESVTASEDAGAQDEGDPCGPDPELRQEYLLLVHYLVARSDALSPELITALEEAADQDGSPDPAAGLRGVMGFVHDETVVETDYPGLAELRSYLNDRDVEIGEAEGDLATVTPRRPH